MTVLTVFPWLNCRFTYRFYEIPCTIHSKVSLQIHRLFGVRQNHRQAFLNIQWECIPLPMWTNRIKNSFIVCGCLMAKQTKQWNVHQYDDSKYEKLCELDRVNEHCLQTNIKANEWKITSFISFNLPRSCPTCKCNKRLSTIRNKPSGKCDRCPKILIQICVGKKS